MCLPALFTCLSSRWAEGKYHVSVPLVEISYLNKKERDNAASKVKKLPHYLDHSTSDRVQFIRECGRKGIYEYLLSVYFRQEAKNDWL
jgi:hypothetical protein